RRPDHHDPPQSRASADRLTLGNASAETRRRRGYGERTNYTLTSFSVSVSASPRLCARTLDRNEPNCPDRRTGGGEDGDLADDRRAASPVVCARARGGDAGV